jgi:carbonic anhydrase
MRPFCSGVKVGGAERETACMSVTDDLLENNERFVAGFELGELEARPAHSVVVVTCMDARIDPALALGLVPGDAHVLRNAGGLVTDDVVRSLAISQHALGTREIMVVQHTRCGMHGLDENALALRIEAAAGTPPNANVRFGAFTDVETSVCASVARLRASTLLLHRDRIRGFVYEVESGRVREIDAP